MKRWIIGMETLFGVSNDSLNLIQLWRIRKESPVSGRHKPQSPTMEITKLASDEAIARRLPTQMTED